MIESARTGYQHNPHCWSIITPNEKAEKQKPSAGAAKEPEYADSRVCPVDQQRLQDSLDLAACFTSPARRLVVLPENQGKTALEMVRGLNCGALLLHPEPGDTASAVFMALIHVRSKDREATVVINPLEHFAPVDTSVIEAASQAVHIVERLPHKAVLLAGESSGNIQNAVWIKRGQKYRDSLDRNLWLWCIPEILSSLAGRSDNDICPEDEGFQQSIYQRGGSYGFTESILMRVSRYLAVLKFPESN